MGLEFFMACHKAIKGTAKFVQVSVIKDEVNATRDELKHFLHSLCYGHQIVTSPTSLPTPTYMADELATRGFELYTTLKTEAPNLLPRNPVELTNMLGY
uniref:Piwi domain-containing protein n=1 Tax=Panagrolaimus sp. JU765 TaxID=591449 RepID=A0AC34RPD3_9BILA